MEITRIFDTLQVQLENNPLQVCLAAKEDSKWKTYSTEDVFEIVNQLSLGLLKMGVKPGDKVGLVSFNRPEWVFVDFAISQIGAINVPMYPNSTPEDYNFIINDAEIKLVFTGNVEITEKIEEATNSFDEKPQIFCLDNIEEKSYWRDVLHHGDYSEIDAYRKEIKNDQLATIIYTSGTTGNPKGVMLSHANIISNSAAVKNAFPHVSDNSRTLSFLPLCHIFERTALYTYMQMGVSIYYAESLDTIADNLKEVKPHFFATVPRLLEKVYEKIVTKGYELSGVKKQLFFWALNLGLKYELNKDQGFLYRFKLGIANKLIFSKWREALGGEIEFIVSGAAALQPRIAQVFWAAQIKVLEAYGLTETSPGVSFTREEPENARIGCVGLLLNDVQVKIADDGEILVKGPNVMMGYYNRPDATAEVIDADGWFHTGDVGKMVDGRFLKITDRKKEIFKTSGGKYIAPQMIENKFKESLLIEQLAVVGENQKYPAAIIVPSFDGIREWCSKKQIQYTNDAEMVKNDHVLNKMQKEVDRLNENFAQYEKVKKFSLLPEAWTIDGGELTPTLKLKRKAIYQKYEKEINNLFLDN